MVKVEMLAEELLQGKLDVSDLPPIPELLESVDRILLKEFDNEFNPISLNKVRSVRKKVLEKIAVTKSELH